MRWVGREPHAMWGLQLDKGSFFLFRRRGSGILQEILICLLSQSLSNEGTWRSSRVLGQILPWLHCCPWIYRCMESWGAKANTGLRKSYADSYFLSFTLFFHTFHTFMMTKFLLVTVIQFHREKKMSLHLFDRSKKWVQVSKGKCGKKSFKFLQRKTAQRIPPWHLPQNGLLTLPTLSQAGLKPCSFLRGGFAAEILIPVIICTLRQSFP